MKRSLLFIICSVLFSACVAAQEYSAPQKRAFSSALNNYIYQYRKEKDGHYRFYRANGFDFLSKEHTQYTDGNEGYEKFFCYDKNNRFYYYTDNTIGFYELHNPEFVKPMKANMKKGKVKKVQESEAFSLVETVLNGMNVKFQRINDSIAEANRIAREKFVKDSLDAIKKKEQERDEYRKSHDWRDLSLSKTYGIHCTFCKTSHSLKDYRVVSISSDTIYYFLDKPDISLLGFNCFVIHYSALPKKMKDDSKFKEYVSVWRDSIANNNNISNNMASMVNIINYNEFTEKIRNAAPNGFIKSWGWDLDYAQGVQPNFTFFNSSKKTVKYVDFYFSIYNPVGDKCYLRYENSYVGNVRGVGPVEPFESGSWNWERATHYTSSDASNMKIVKLVITYMDGTTKTIPSNAIIYDY